MIQFAKYLLVGVVNTGIGYAIIFTCMYVLDMPAVHSNFIGYALGMVISYLLNRVYTFKGSRADFETLVRFCVVTVTAYLANLAALVYLIQSLRIHEGAAQLLAGIVYVIVSFLTHKYFVFRPKESGKAP